MSEPLRSDQDDESLARRIAAELGEGTPRRLDPEFDARVMRDVRVGGGPRLGWTWPTGRGRAGFVGAVAAALAAGLVGGFWLARVALPSPPSPSEITFRLVAPEARSVALVGDFNDWDKNATPLQRIPKGGAWVVQLQLRPGNYAYAFVVDGERWVPDPVAPRAASDDFGVPNSVVAVAGS
jgi:hypothetical protein